MIQNMLLFPRIFILCLIIAVTLGMNLVPAAQAQILLETDQTSSPEEVALAFFKTAHTVPDFKKWAANSEEAKVTPPSKIKEFIGVESQRLKNLYDAYDPNRNFISIRTHALIRLHVTKDKNNNQQLSMSFKFKQGDAEYFPFVFQDYTFAVIPQMLPSFLQQPIERAQHDRIAAFLGDRKKRMVEIFLQLRPSKAYIATPYVIDGHEQWAFLTDIAMISISEGGRALWQYSAPWYVSPVTEDIRDMYVGKNEDNSAPLVTPLEQTDKELPKSGPSFE